MQITSAKIKKPDENRHFGEFKPGDIDPTTGREIIYIAYQTDKFYVSIDAGINLNWSASGDLDYAPDFGEIVSHVSLTDALVDRIFIGKRNRIAYKKILADVLSRLLEEGNSKSARQTMKEAKLRVLAHSNARIRMAYISHAVVSVIFVGLLVIAAILLKNEVINIVGNPDVFRVIICTLLGGIGAFISTFFRFQNYQGSIISGLPIHRLDGALRVFYGLVAGLIVSLAIKGQVLAGFANGASPWILYFFGMIAGASEALIPNLIKQTEKHTNLNITNDEVEDPIIGDQKPAGKSLTLTLTNTESENNGELQNLEKTLTEKTLDGLKHNEVDGVKNNGTNK